MPNPLDKYMPKDWLTDSSSLPELDANTAHKRLAEIMEKRRKIDQMRASIDQKIKVENEKSSEINRKIQEIQAEIDRLLGDK